MGFCVFDAAVQGVTRKTNEMAYMISSIRSCAFIYVESASFQGLFEVRCLCCLRELPDASLVYFYQATTPEIERFSGPGHFLMKPRTLSSLKSCVLEKVVERETFILKFWSHVKALFAVWNFECSSSLYLWNYLNRQAKRIEWICSVLSRVKITFQTPIEDHREKESMNSSKANSTRWMSRTIPAKRSLWEIDPSRAKVYPPLNGNWAAQ